MKLFLWCCFGFVLFVTLCQKQNIFISCCLIFFDGLYMLENTGNRFLSLIFNLFVLLSLDTD